MTNEKVTDFFIGNLLSEAHISCFPNGSDIKEVHEALKTASKHGTGNVGFPEFTGQSGKFLIVIENKADEDRQALYQDEEKNVLDTSTRAVIDYAENGALHYAQHLVKHTRFKKIFAFGCSGNKNRHTIRPIYVDESGYTLLEKVENFSNFSRKNILNYYKQQVLGEAAPEALELEEILRKAKVLHEHLQNYGQLGTSEKPLVVSAILLALNEKTFSLDNLLGDSLKTDGQILFDCVSSYMERVKVTPSTKKEQVLAQFNIIKTSPLLNQINSHLAKTPLRYFTEYLQDNILHSIKENSSEDVLGRFYGEFISYSGGDGQTLGVILTPKHITELFCDLVDIKPNDRVFDPCCGTSGFLIAAMHRMLQQTEKTAEHTGIKKNQLFGVEIRNDINIARGVSHQKPDGWLHQSALFTGQKQGNRAPVGNKIHQAPARLSDRWCALRGYCSAIDHGRENQRR